MTDVKLLNEELTDKMAEIEKTGKPCNIKLSKMENWMKGNNVGYLIRGYIENAEKIILKIFKKLDAYTSGQKPDW